MATVQQSVLELLRHYKLTTWFGNPGSSELALLQNFPPDFRYFLGLQEMIPLGMADAFSQITRRPAVVQLHTAPGTGNAVGALYNAFWNKSPLIVLAGNQRRNMQNQNCLLTNVEATTLPRPYVKWAAEPSLASETPAVLAHAIHLALTPPRGPVYLSLPMDDMDVELTAAQIEEHRVIRERRVVHGYGVSPEISGQVAKRLDQARNPVIVVGGDVEREGAWDGVIALAEKLSAIVWTAPLAGLSGFPENHALYGGTLPPGAGWISGKLAGHDLILVLGAPAFRYYPQIAGPYIPAGASLLQVTSDPDEAARAPVGDAIIANVRAFIEAVLPQASKSTRKAPPARAASPYPAAALKAPLPPDALYATLNRVAPKDTLWITEAGSNEFHINECIRAGHPFSHLSSAGAGLGYGLPAAVGAALGAPERPAVALMGDGSIQYAIVALWTAAAYKVPLTIVVASNAEYGVLKEFAKIEHAEGVPGMDLPGLDIVNTAKSYGVRAHEATSTGDVEDLFTQALKSREQGPTLINVPVTRVKL